jgi:hypothetical protein
MYSWGMFISLIIKYKGEIHMKISLNDYVIKKQYKVHNLFLQQYYMDKGEHIYNQYCSYCPEDVRCSECSYQSIMERYQNEEYLEFEKLMSHIYPKCEKCYNLY